MAAPAFAEIASYAVRHFGIAPPPEIAASQNWTKPDYTAPIEQNRVVSEVAVQEEAPSVEEPPAATDSPGQGDLVLEEGSFELANPAVPEG